jgi:hypothetical protein
MGEDVGGGEMEPGRRKRMGGDHGSGKVPLEEEKGRTCWPRRRTRARAARRPSPRRLLSCRTPTPAVPAAPPFGPPVGRAAAHAAAGLLRSPPTPASAVPEG